MDPGFLPIWIRTSKTRIRISPFFALIYYWDLSDVLWLGLRGAWPKKIVLRTWECYLGYNIFLNLYLQFLVFFSRIRIWIFRIRSGFFGRSRSGLRKKCQIRIRPKGPGLETLYFTPGKLTRRDVIHYSGRLTPRGIKPLEGWLARVLEPGGRYHLFHYSWFL